MISAGAYQLPSSQNITHHSSSYLSNTITDQRRFVLVGPLEKQSCLTITHAHKSTLTRGTTYACYSLHSVNVGGGRYEAYDVRKAWGWNFS